MVLVARGSADYLSGLTSRRAEQANEEDVSPSTGTNAQSKPLARTIREGRRPAAGAHPDSVRNNREDGRAAEVSHTGFSPVARPKEQEGIHVQAKPIGQTKDEEGSNVDSREAAPANKEEDNRLSSKSLHILHRIAASGTTGAPFPRRVLFSVAIHS